MPVTDQRYFRKVPGFVALYPSKLEVDPSGCGAIPESSTVAHVLPPSLDPSTDTYLRPV
jgi:hypothetical protein